MSKLWIFLLLCQILVVTMTYGVDVRRLAGLTGEELDEDAAFREADLIRQFGNWLYYHQGEWQSKRSGGDGNTQNLGSGCDCSFQVFCTRDSDCSSKKANVDGESQDNKENCKMDCCGSRCEKEKSVKTKEN